MRLLSKTMPCISGKRHWDQTVAQTSPNMCLFFPISYIKQPDLPISILWRMMSSCKQRVNSMLMHCD